MLNWLLAITWTVVGLAVLYYVVFQMDSAMAILAAVAWGCIFPKGFAMALLWNRRRPPETLPK